MDKFSVPQREVKLLTVDKDSNAVSDAVLAEITEEYSIVEGGGGLSKEQVARIQGRGEILDYQKTLLQMVKRARGEGGMGYDEMEALRPVVKKIKEAKPGASVLLDEAEFEDVCEKVKKPYLLIYNEAFDVFVHSVLNSEKVQED